jgi:hypothetical protein
MTPPHDGCCWRTHRQSVLVLPRVYFAESNLGLIGVTLVFCSVWKGMNPFMMAAAGGNTGRCAVVCYPGFTC